MSESSPRTVTRIVWGALRTGVYVALAGIVLFFALTRTDVGRNQIRQGLQSAFNERFAGSLHIETLQGTLLTDLTAVDVQLRDKEGQSIVSIDSVAAEPSWSSLLTGTLSATSLTFVRPHLALHRRANGTWNVRAALQRRSPTSSTRPLDVSISNIEVQNGRVTTSRSGTAPSSVQNRWLFDYTRSAISAINVTAGLHWTGAQRRLDLRTLQLDFPDQRLSLQSAQADLVKKNNQWQLPHLSFQLGNTRVEAEGTVKPSSRDSKRSAATLTIAESRLDHDQLRRFIPRLPLHDEMTIEGKVSGSVSRFVVNRLTLRHRNSRATVEGTAFGLPDSVNVDARLLQSRIRPTDLRSVWPNAPLDRVRSVGPIDLSATVQGALAWRGRPHLTFDLTSTLSAQGQPGAVRGSLDVERARNAAPTYDGQVQVDSLNLASLTDRDRLDSRLTGRVDVEGTGVRLDSLRGNIQASLSKSRIGPRRLSTADVNLVVNQQNAWGALSLQQPNGGSLSLQGTVDNNGPTPVYDLTASTESFNLEQAHSALPSSQFNATLAAEGEGDTWRTLTGSLTVSVDRSRLDHGAGGRLLAPQQTTVTLTDPASSRPRLQVNGSLAAATVDGTILAPSLRRSGRLWLNALHGAVERELKTAERVPSNEVQFLDPPSSPLPDTLNSAPLSRPRHIEGEVEIHRMDLLRQWWPNAPEESHGLRATTTLTIGADTLSASGTFHADRLHVGGRRADSLSASYEIEGPFQANLSEVLNTSFSAHADTLHLGTRHLLQPSFEFSLVRGSGTLRAAVQRLGRTGPFRLASDLQLRNGLRLRIHDLYAGLGQDAWTTRRPGNVVIHTDGVTADSLALESPRPDEGRDQRLLLHGTLSPASTDTLRAEMSDVLLYPVGELLSLTRPLGGQLDGEIALTGGWGQPQMRSDVTVDRLSFDRRVLGTLSAQTRIAAGSPDLLVTADLTPGPSSLKSLRGPPLVPNGPRTIEENALQIQGRVRLPGWAPNAKPDSDPLDLNVTVDRADLFFFKYIFDETLADIRGYTTGTIHVGGHFLHPVFDADMAIRDAHFSLPKFGLSYNASGPVEVDREGIHVQRLSVRDDDGSGLVRGSILFNDYQFFSFDLSATLDALSIINVNQSEALPFYGQIRASGPVTLSGRLSNATLRSDGARTTPDSELYIPVTETGVEEGTGFFVFADSTGTIPDLRDLTQRDNILSDRPEGESSFLDGLDIDINILAPDESKVHLVFDSVVGDVVTAVGSGRVQLQREEGEFRVFGNYNVTGGTYLFTAGEVFVRRFSIDEGTITWDGPPTNAQLDLQAEYRTRASPAGLPGYDDNSGRIPLRVLLDIGGRVRTPQVNLSLARVRDQRTDRVGSRALDAVLNQSARTTEYATSVLLTNTFLLTTESFTGGQTAGSDNTSSGSLTTAGNQLAFNSVSQLVSSQLNRYLGAALPNVDLNVGVQGEDPSDLDVIYGVALRLLNERLLIRGEGVYTGDDPAQRQSQGPEGEFVVEVRLSDRIRAEAFYRRSGDELTRGQTLTSSTGAGVSYQSRFPNWRTLFRRIFGWLLPDDSSDESDASSDPSDDATDDVPDEEGEDPPSEEEASEEPVVRRNSEPDRASGPSAPRAQYR